MTYEGILFKIKADEEKKVFQKGYFLWHSSNENLKGGQKSGNTRERG